MHQPRGHIIGDRRNFGYIPDKQRDRDARPPVKALLAHFGAQAIPASGSLAAYRSATFDQGQDGDCGGCGSAQLNDTALRASGLVLPWDTATTKGSSSPYHIYGNTRVQELTNPTDELTDSGVQPTDLITALAKYGTRSMLLTPGLVNGLTPDGRYCDVWGAADIANVANASPNVNTKPDQLDEEQGIQNLIVGEYTIPTGQTGSGGTDDQMASTLTIVKRPVGVGLFVDSGVMNWTPDQGPINSINQNDPQGGGHWVCVDEVTTMEVANVTQRVYTIHNSWGTSYGSNGCVLITASCLAQVMSDCIAWTARIGS